MMVHKLTVDGTELFLDPSQDVQQAKNEIVHAVQQGGGMVDVVVAGPATISVLVGQRTPVTFETIDAHETEADAESMGMDADNADIWDWADRYM